MKYLPSIEDISRESVEMLAMANILIVASKGQGFLKVFPYAEQVVSEIGPSSIIEKLLSVSIKLRYLDDRTDILSQYERKNFGQVRTGKKIDCIGLRESLNKIIHSKSMNISFKSRRFVVSKIYGDESVGLQIPEGSYEGCSMFLEAQGSQRGKQWVFNTELFRFSDEVFRVVEHFKMQLD